MLHKSKTRKLGETVSPRLDGWGAEPPKKFSVARGFPSRKSVCCVPSPRYNQSSKARVPCPCSEPSLVARSPKTSAKTQRVWVSKGKTKLSVTLLNQFPSRFSLR